MQFSGDQLTAENISKGYGKRPIVKDISLTIKPGEVVGLLGGNGAGKTTTFYVICGLVRPDFGQVCLGQQNITEFAMNDRARLGIAYLAQEHSVFTKLSVEDNLRLVMEQSGVSRQYWEQKITKLLDQFNLQTVRRNIAGILSGGEKRRVEIARALAAGQHPPKFLLLDEPFAGIDPITVGDVQKMISELKDEGMGILITDHNVGATLAITDRAYILHEGCILAEGSPKELAENPPVRQFYLGENFRLS